MPLYTYRCRECNLIEDIRHSMEEKNIFLSCGHNIIEKIPSQVINVSKAIDRLEKCAGELVKDTIESTKKEIREERDKAGKKIWKP